MKKIVLYFVFLFIISCSSSTQEPLRSGNSITLFQLEINGQLISGQIDQSERIIVLNVVDADLTSLRPVIEISDGATINPSLELSRNFNQATEYTVTAENGDKKTYTVIVNNKILSRENLITLFQFSINDELVTGNINQIDNIILFDLIGADITSLVPIIEISDNATINPSNGIQQDFSESVMYTVTAENGNENIYAVIVNNRPLSTENNILSFNVGINGEDIEARIDQDSKEISFETGSFNISRLVPEITISDNAIISPASGEPVDFTVPVVYTVTAENGEIKEYTVSINQAFKVNPNIPYALAPLVYTRVKMFVVTDFLDPRLPGVELYLFDGLNRIDLPIQTISQYESNRIIKYVVETKVPEETISSTDYKVVYKLGESSFESEIDLDILAENSPKITSVNQDVYRPGDELIITGENLTGLTAIPSNGNLYIMNPLGNINANLNNEKTEYKLLLETQPSATFTAFFFYSGATRDIIFYNQDDKRMGEQITINVQR